MSRIVYQNSSGHAFLSSTCADNTYPVERFDWSEQRAKGKQLTDADYDGLELPTCYVCKKQYQWKTGKILWLGINGYEVCPCCAEALNKNLPY